MGNCCRKSFGKLLQEIVAEKSSGKILWENLVGNLAGNLVGNSVGNAMGNSPYLSPNHF